MQMLFSYNFSMKSIENKVIKLKKDKTTVKLLGYDFEILAKNDEFFEKSLKMN